MEPPLKSRSKFAPDNTTSPLVQLMHYHLNLNYLLIIGQFLFESTTIAELAVNVPAVWSTKSTYNLPPIMSFEHRHR